MRGGRGHLLAIRADEPPHARHAHCDKEGCFAFEDLPPGDYVVKLDVPDVEQVQPANVIVVANETTVATLMMNSVSVKLRLKVPGGRTARISSSNPPARAPGSVVAFAES